MSLDIGTLIELNNKVHEICGWDRSQAHSLDIGYDVLEKGDLHLYCNIQLNVFDDDLVNSIPTIRWKLAEACGHYVENIKVYDFEDSPSGYLVDIQLNKETRQ